MEVTPVASRSGRRAARAQLAFGEEAELSDDFVSEGFDALSVDFVSDDFVSLDVDSPVEALELEAELLLRLSVL
jgi:hypothetical protein